MGTELVPVTRLIVDGRAELEQFLRAQHAAGRLVTPPEDIRPTPTARNPEKYWLRATFLVPAPKLTLRQRAAAFDKRHPIGGPVLKALAFGVAVLIGALALGALLFALVVHTFGAAAAGLGALLMIVPVALIGRGRSRGRHGNHDGKGWHYTPCE